MTPTPTTKPTTPTWRTTLVGLLLLGLTAFRIYSNPALLADPATLGLITSGAGLIGATDKLLGH
jgi:hypothetical protein